MTVEKRSHQHVWQLPNMVVRVCHPRFSHMFTIWRCTSRHTSDSKQLFFSFSEHLHVPVAIDCLPIYPSILHEKQLKSLSYEGCDVCWTLGGGPCDNSSHSWMQWLIIIDASSPLSWSLFFHYSTNTSLALKAIFNIYSFNSQHFFEQCPFCL